MPVQNGNAPSASLFPHDADIGVRGIGRTKDEAFEQVALALCSAVADPANVRPLTEKHIECRAPNDEVLLADWLNALIFEMGVSHLLFCRFEVHLESGRLSGTAWGEPLDVERHAVGTEPKGATFTGLRVVPLAEGAWLAECIVDV